MSPRRGAIGWNEQKEAVEGFVLMRRGENPSRVLHGVHAKIDELNNEIKDLKAKKKKLAKVATQLPPELLDQLRQYSEDSGMRVQTIFAEAVKLYLRECAQ